MLTPTRHKQFFQFDYTFGPQVSRDPYHIHVLRSQLARNVEPCFEDIREEMVLAFDKAVPCPGSSQGEGSFGLS